MGRSSRSEGELRKLAASYLGRNLGGFYSSRKSTTTFFPSDGPTGSYSGPDPFWEFLCLSFSTFLAVSKGASQGQSIYLILRPTVAQKRTVSKEVF